MPEGPLWAWKPGRSTELPVLSSAGSRRNSRLCFTLHKARGPTSWPSCVSSGAPGRRWADPRGDRRQGLSGSGPNVYPHPCAPVLHLGGHRPSFIRQTCLELLLWAQPALGTGDVSASGRRSQPPRGHEPTGQQGVHGVSACAGQRESAWRGMENPAASPTLGHQVLCSDLASPVEGSDGCSATRAGQADPAPVGRTVPFPGVLRSTKPVSPRDLGPLAAVDAFGVCGSRVTSVTHTTGHLGAGVSNKGP